MSELSLPKNVRVKRPWREPDFVSARGIGYWWAPEWVRDLNGSIGRIKPIRDGDDVDLYMCSKSGNLTYIRGRIQYGFRRWHQDNEIDYILLGVDVDEVMATDWEYESE